MKSILAALIKAALEVDGIRWADEDNGQLDNYETRPPVDFPCCLVSVSQRAEPLGGGLHDVTGTITLRVAFDRSLQRPGTANADALEKSYHNLDIADAVIDHFTGFESEGVCGSLQYAGFVPEQRGDTVAVKAITFIETHEENFSDFQQ